MSLESGQRCSMEELKKRNMRVQQIPSKTIQQKTPTAETETPTPQPIVVQCTTPEMAERMDQRLRMLEQLSNTQANLLRTLTQNTDSDPTWRQMDALIKQMDGLQKQVAHLEKMAEQAGKPKEKHSWLSKLHLPRITLPTVEWPVVILVLMMLAALVMIWLFLGKNLNGWMSLLR